MNLYLWPLECEFHMILSAMKQDFSSGVFLVYKMYKPRLAREPQAGRGWMQPTARARRAPLSTPEVPLRNPGPQPPKDAIPMA